MFYNIIPLILILICGLVIIYVITRKFPALANLDLSTIPQEKEARVKQQILQSRLKRKVNKWILVGNKLLYPLRIKIGRWIKTLYDKLRVLKENYQKESRAATKGDAAVNELFSEAEELIKKEEYEEAERKYIQAISIDSKNIKAFKLLGELYLVAKKLPEAKETFEHVLKLTAEDADVYAHLAEIAQAKGNLEKAKSNYLQSIELNNAKSQNYYNLADVYRAMNNNKEALNSIKEALKIEPNNPKYLDTMVNLSIITKEKADAWEAYKKLKEINPENKKLSEMKKQIDDL